MAGTGAGVPRGKPRASSPKLHGRIPGKDEAMLSFVKRLINEESGQDLAEYGIALAVIAVGAAAAAVVIAGDVQTLWESGRDAIAQALP